MNALTQSLTLRGPAGTLDALLDTPLLAEGAAPRGTAVIAHPHPQFGGTMTNKVVQTVARACVLCGWRALRFNFRGVGTSQGTYDEGRGELQDMLAAIEQQAPIDAPLLIAGFSFGAFVASHAIAALQDQRPIARVVLVGTAASRFDVAPIAAELHEHTLVIHGEQDDTVPWPPCSTGPARRPCPSPWCRGAAIFFTGNCPCSGRW